MERVLILVLLTLMLSPTVARADEPSASDLGREHSLLMARSLRNAGIYSLACSGAMSTLGLVLMLPAQSRRSMPFIVGAVSEGVAGAELVFGGVALGVGQHRLMLLEQQAPPRNSAADRMAVTAAAR
jgi:hypothetical protein